VAFDTVFPPPFFRHLTTNHIHQGTILKLVQVVAVDKYIHHMLVG
jgi:hypothetical protein